MSEITTEERLKILNQIRQEHNHNRETIRSRENFIYGNSSSIPLNPSKLSYMDEFTESKEFTDKSVHKEASFRSTFGIRMLIAALLLVGYFFLESNNVNLGILDAEIIRTEVNRYSGQEINLFDFMDNITYTFNND